MVAPCVLCEELYASKSALSRHRSSDNPLCACLGNRLLRSCGVIVDHQRRPGHRYAHLLRDLRSLWGGGQMELSGLRQMLGFYQSSANYKSIDDLTEYVSGSDEYFLRTDLQTGDQMLRGTRRLAKVATNILFPWFRIARRPYKDYSHWCVFSDKRKRIQFKDHYGRTIPYAKIRKYLFAIVKRHQNEFGVECIDIGVAVSDFHAALLELEAKEPLYKSWRAFGQLARELQLRV